ncbi:hypothetical protein QTO34_017248 [Cnephaeus nilssonii]|uniref:Uncharacterized protein n=1 Tax=Cnephaeus nilssonii TaxID=3371016 RepID=A0AA40I0P3_CNENI|nr:hypothetical protein QTO34_017248 [Eptesicus nilssonii]
MADRGKVLECFVECFEEIKVFLDDKDLGNFPQLNDDNSLELNGFQWMQIDDLEMQLAEFQDSIWAQVFVNLMSKLENLERCHLENQEECHYEQEIWSAWNQLPDTFSTLKNSNGFTHNFSLYILLLWGMPWDTESNPRTPVQASKSLETQIRLAPPPLGKTQTRLATYLSRPAPPQRHSEHGAMAGPPTNRIAPALAGLAPHMSPHMEMQ